MIKLIASDVDGTLIQDGSQKLQERLFPLIRKLTDMGILFVAASGRQYPNLYRLFGPVQDDIAYICENGCLVRKNKETLYKAEMDEALALEIIHKIVEKDTAEVLVSGEDTSYIRPKTDAFRHLLEEVVVNNVTVVDDIFTLRETPFKISVYEETGIDATQEYWREAFRGRATAVTSGFEWLDFTPVGANKGKALDELLKRLHISPDECMAFGDEYNDIEMLQNVGYSYAMRTAKPGVQAAARFLTDMVETVLEQLIEQNGVWEERKHG